MFFQTPTSADRRPPFRTPHTLRPAVCTTAGMAGRSPRPSERQRHYCEADRDRCSRNRMGQAKKRKREKRYFIRKALTIQHAILRIPNPAKLRNRLATLITFSFFDKRHKNTHHGTYLSISSRLRPARCLTSDQCAIRKLVPSQSSRLILAFLISKSRGGEKSSRLAAR